MTPTLGDGPAPSLRLLGAFQLLGASWTPRGSARRLLALVAQSDGGIDRRAASELIDGTDASVPRLVEHGLLATPTAERLSIANGIAVDATALARWAAAVRTGGATTPAADAAAIASDAPLLAGWREPWVLFHRARLWALRVTGLAALTTRLTATGRHDEALAAGRAAVRAAPLREGPRRALVRAYGAAGRMAEAGQEYGDYRRRLHDELGIEPSAGFQKAIASLGVVPSHPGDAPVTEPG